jgi:hypothetical protein
MAAAVGVIRSAAVGVIRFALQGLSGGIPGARPLAPVEERRVFRF